MGELQRGVVKWFNDAKGFGFIEHSSGRDVFVHYSVIETEGFKTLKDGEQVDYELREGDKGLNASRVIRVNPPVKDKIRDGAGDEVSASDGAVASSLQVERIVNPTIPEAQIQASAAVASLKESAEG